MSSRTYLSIGDVLTLLREEFPDVTISKIRFLESQGLVNPERSPSGYRKFFDHDVERLRWVLRQQREHFLPLKVIRDRLADGNLEDIGMDAENGKTVEPAPKHAAAMPAVAVEDERPTKADEEAMARILADASRRTARMPEAAEARRGLQVLGEEASAAAVAAAPAANPAPPRHAQAAGGGGAVEVPPSASSASHGAGPADAAPGATPPSPSPSDAGRANGTTQPGGTAPPAAPAAGATAPTPPAARRAPSSGRDAPGTGAAASPGSGAAAIVTGASMTAAELCAASGLTPDELVGLQGFGLVCPVVVAGMETYDEEALTVANLAAAFRGFGIEPRHLRMYRNAVDRELGLIEQVVIPLLRQRNPESRQRAVEAADQLAALGQSMRASLLRQALRQHFGG